MSKNENEYINAVNEIKADETMKRKLYGKIREGNRKKISIVYAYAMSAIAVVLILSIAFYAQINRNKNTGNQLVAEVKEGEELPKIGTFANLYSLLDIGSNRQMVAQGGRGLEESMSLDTANSAKAVEGGATKNESSADFSKTNIQVEGVDEADIVKTDGKYIYYVSAKKIVILDSSKQDNLKIVSEIEYKNEGNDTFYPQEIFINSNKLIVIGSRNVILNENSKTQDYEMLDRIYSISSKSYTVAKVYNVKDKANVKLEREVELEGNYTSSRMIGDNVYFLANQYINTYIAPILEADDLDENFFKPLYRDTAVDESEKCLEFSQIYYCPGAEDKSYLNIAGFNINNKLPANIESVFGAGNQVYASENNLYVTNVKYKYEDTGIGIFGISNKYEVSTTIYKFKLNNGKAKYENNVEIPGVPVNQFAMDENNKYFRIALTNSTDWSGEDSTNNLYILDEDMKIVGKLENLAIGEKIYSVRFMGDKAYMVTFVQTDPLFVIDLSNPTNPNVLGELKIPGYSTYLHPYDENHIIGIGENTKTVNYGYGERVTTDGMKMALFDVTDPTNPKELYSMDIGEKGTYSEALYNHKALLFSKEKNIIAFPIAINNSEDTTMTNITFQGAIVYGLDLNNGFTLRGKIAHQNVTDKNRDYNKEVERIIYIGNNLYTLSKGLVKATDMNTMQEKASVEIKINEPEYIVF